jgi:DNA-binding transcriptional MerR regulator
MIPARTLYELYWDRKMSQKNIAMRCGVNKSTVQEWMQKYGIAPRTKEDAYRLSRDQRRRKPQHIVRRAKEERSLAEKVAIGSAVRDSKRYRHESIVSFLPDSPALELQWRNMLAKVKRERGAAWNVLVTHR